MELLKYFLYVITRVKNYLRAVSLAFTLKGPKAFPLLGNVLMLNSDTLEYVGTNFYQSYGSLVRTWVSIIPMFWICEPKHVKIILGSSKNSQKNFIYSFLHNFLGNGLVTRNGQQWKKNRKLIQPYFHLNVLETQIKCFVSSAKNLTDDLIVGPDVKITNYVNNCLLEILHRSILGVPMDWNSPYRKGDVRLIERITRPWLLLDTFFSFTKNAKKENEQRTSLHAYTKKLIQQKENSPETPGDCLLGYLLQLTRKNSDFTMDDVVDETITFMLAGQDTVGAGLAFTLYYIAKHEDVQNKILEEIMATKDEPLSLQALNNMKFTEQVIKESLRLAPSVPVLSRELTEDINIDGKILPEGTNIVISPFITHRLPHVYEDPLKFDPGRFSEENLENMDPYSYIPFSMGPRNCIGYKFAFIEMKTIIFYLLKKYKFSLSAGYEKPVLVLRATLRAKGGIRLNVQLRK